MSIKLTTMLVVIKLTRDAKEKRMGGRLRLGSAVVAADVAARGTGDQGGWSTT